MIPDGTGESPLDLRLVPAALTAWAVTASGIIWPIGYFTAFVLGLGLIGTLLGRKRLPETIAASVVALLVAGAGFALAAAMRYQAVHEHPLASRVGQLVTAQVRVTEDPRPIAGGARVMVRGNLVSIDDVAKPSIGGVVIFGSARSAAPLDVGQTVRVRATVARPTRRDLTVATLTMNGPVEIVHISAIHRLANDIRGHLIDAGRSALPAEEAALLPALVLGDTSALDTETTTMFRASGLTHLMAVSGANVSIVCGAVLLLGRLIGPRAAVVLAAVVLVGFVVLVRPSPSVLRAAVMGGIGLLGVLTSRRRQAIPALAATILVLLIVWPELAVDIGFTLSVVATAALVILAPRFSVRLTARGWPRPLADALSIAVAAQLVTAPLIAAISGTVSLSSIGANLAAAVVIAPITILGTAAAAVAVVSPTAAGVVIRFCGPELWWLLRVADYASADGTTAIAVPSGLVGLVVVVVGLGISVLLWRRRWFRGLTWCGALCVLALVLSARLVS